MSKITFAFEDLCALFTSKLPRQLMVGLIDNRQTEESVPRADKHEPQILIKEVGGDVVKQYLGFKQLQGDIFLDLYNGASRHVLSRLTKADGRRHPFRYLIDIERQLYPNRRLGVDANACKARLHFRDGELYTTGRLFRIKFAEPDATKGGASKQAKAAITCGLDVTVPARGRAVLHFSQGADDFEFNPKKNYRVTVANQAPTVDRNHFKYYYGIMRQPPPVKLVPNKFSTEDGAEASDPFCMIGGFGDADYQLETSHLDW